MPHDSFVIPDDSQLDPIQQESESNKGYFSDDYLNKNEITGVVPGKSGEDGGNTVPFPYSVKSKSSDKKLD